MSDKQMPYVKPSKFNPRLGMFLDLIMRHGNMFPHCTILAAGPWEGADTNVSTRGGTWLQYESNVRNRLFLKTDKLLISYSTSRVFKGEEGVRKVSLSVCIEYTSSWRRRFGSSALLQRRPPLTFSCFAIWCSLCSLISRQLWLLACRCFLTECEQHEEGRVFLRGGPGRFQLGCWGVELASG